MNLNTIKRAIPEPINRVLRRLLTHLNIRKSAPSNQALEKVLLEKLDQHFSSALNAMYKGYPQLGFDGQSHSIDSSTRISLEKGLWLYDFCLSNKPNNCIEIGMAYGFSTLFIMAAISKLGSGHHTSIDPFQKNHWNGIGLSHALKASELGVQFTFIEERSDRASTDLARAGENFDLFFIDGNHKFDDVLVDFYLYEPLCSIGGHIIFDDANWNAIQSVIAFIRTNRPDFKEVQNVPDGWCAFQKVEVDQRHWSHFRKFPVSADSGPA